MKPKTAVPLNYNHIKEMMDYYFPEPSPQIRCFDDAVIEGLKRKGYTFDNKEQATSFVK